MGGSKSPICNSIAKATWLRCIDKNIGISAEHLPGSENVVADKESRVFNDFTEWMLNKDVFSELIKIHNSPDIDLFASRLNKQVERFVSWKPDPDAIFIDEFTISWRDLFFYAFPPFSVISKCLHKIRTEGAEGIVIISLWPTQPWFAPISVPRPPTRLRVLVFPLMKST